MKAQTGTEASLVRMLGELVRPLVGSPERVMVNSLSHGERTDFIVEVAPEDVGKVFGGGGRTAESLRVIVRAAGIKADRRYALDIREGRQIAELTAG